MSQRPTPKLLACVAATLFAVGCGGDDTSTAQGAVPDFVVGGNRPVTVRVPPTYTGDTAAPLVILLHGYGATGFLEDTYLEYSTVALERGAFFAAPDGTPDSKGRNFWNATDACCNFEGADVDDSAYLMGLVDAIAAKVRVDPKRVYFTGHSNGAFMAHRMACEHADRIAAIATLAGVLQLDTSQCKATEPVSVLQIHGTADDTVHYEGGQDLGAPGGFPGSAAYPSVAATMARWAELDGCAADPMPGAPLDLDFSIDGSETQVDTYPGCKNGSAVKLWSIAGGSHIPGLYYYFGAVVMDFLFDHPKP